DARIRPMHDRGPNPVGPRPPIFGARGGERSSGNLLGIETVRRPLRRVPADRKRSGNRLSYKMVPEAGLVLQRWLRGARLDCRVSGLGVLLGDLAHANSRQQLKRSTASKAKQFSTLRLQWRLLRLRGRLVSTVTIGLPRPSRKVFEMILSKR